MNIPRRLAALAFASALITGCGGGGGSASSPAGSNPASGTLSHNGVTASLSNADFSLTEACPAFTLTPTNAADASVLFEEKTDVDTTPAPNNDTQFRFRGAFTSALQFPINPASTLVHVIVFDAGGNQLIEVKAPIASVGGTACAGTPVAGPSPSATPDDNDNEPEPEATPSPKPTATATPHNR